MIIVFPFVANHYSIDSKDFKSAFDKRCGLTFEIDELYLLSMEPFSPSKIDINRMRHELCKMWFVCDDNVQVLMDGAKYWVIYYEELEGKPYVEIDHSILFPDEDEDMGGITWKESELADALCEILDEMGINYHLSNTLLVEGAEGFLGKPNPSPVKDFRYSIVARKKIFSVEVFQTYAEIFYNDLCKKYPPWNKEEYSRLAEWMHSLIKQAENGGHA
jgi:hypothetical protein